MRSAHRPTRVRYKRLSESVVTSLRTWRLRLRRRWRGGGEEKQKPEKASAPPVEQAAQVRGEAAEAQSRGGGKEEVEEGKADATEE